MKINNFSKIIIAFALLAVLFAVSLFLYKQQITKNNNPSENPVVSDYKNLSFVIEGQSVALVNGYAQKESAAGSASKIITRYFGNEAFGDLNADGKEDAVFLLTQETGGSGVFFYVAAALKIENGYQPTNTILFGDRIAPQTTEINDGIVMVNYAIREPGFPMTAAPSVGVSDYFKIENGVLTSKSMLPAFGMPRKMVINTPIQFTDGLTVVLEKINDSRCKPGVVCIWAGELSPHFGISGGNVTNPGAEFDLGTTTQKSITINGYKFTLQEATETTATITVTKELKSLGTCYIGGCSSEICSDQQGVVSNCAYDLRYACYKTATCQKQKNGQCGWTQTQELVNCIAKVLE